MGRCIVFFNATSYVTDLNCQHTRLTRACSTLSLPCQVYKSLLLEERLSDPSALDNNGPCHNVIYSPVVLEEEESDEDGKEESNGEVLIKCPHCRAVKVRTKRDKTKVWG